MSYSQKNPTVAFRIEKKLFDKLIKKAEIKKITNSEYSREIITKFLKDELIENNQTEYDKLKLEKLKVIVETMENESLTDTEWGAVCDLMKEGATFETAKNTIIDAK